MIDDILSWSCDKLTDVLRQHGYSAYRARQIWHWLYARQAADWDDMRNLPGDLRKWLRNRFLLGTLCAVHEEKDSDGTHKILVGLQDGQRVETVVIPAPRRVTLCVSCQVGCRFRCAFCASGQAGWVRHLTPGEIVGQLLLATRQTGLSPSHVVYMGVGEPLDNYDAVMRSVRILNHRDGLAIGARRITLSTCGIIPGIERLAREGLQIELSVSLHACRQELRARLMPVSRRYPLDALLEACWRYAASTGRIITFEYVLIAGVNDSARDAHGLAGLLRGRPGRVNLLPFNPVAEFPGQPASKAAIGRFVSLLTAGGIHATVRRPRGCSIHAACGQLRRSSCEGVS